MTIELTPQEIEAIKKEADKYTGDWILTFWNERPAFKDIETAYAAALTSERLKHRVEIQAYREALNKIIDLYPNTESKAIIALNDMRQAAYDTLNQFKDK